MEEPDAETRMRMYFPVCETLDDIPVSISRQSTREARLAKLEALWEKGIFGRGEYNTYKSIIRESPE